MVLEDKLDCPESEIRAKTLGKRVIDKVRRYSSNLLLAGMLAAGILCSPPPAKAEEPPRTAVLIHDFRDNQKENPAYKKNIPSELEKALSEDFKVLRDTSQSDQAEALITGEYWVYGREIQIKANYLDLNTKQEIRSDKKGAAIEYKAMVQELAEDILEKLKPKEGEGSNSKTVTKWLERAFVEGDKVRGGFEMDLGTLISSSGEILNPAALQFGIGGREFFTNQFGASFMLDYTLYFPKEGRSRSTFHALDVKIGLHYYIQLGASLYLDVGGKAGAIMINKYIDQDIFDPQFSPLYAIGLGIEKQGTSNFFVRMDFNFTHPLEIMDTAKSQDVYTQNLNSVGILLGGRF